MRSVSSATWTSVVPVSPSPWPNLATISCLRSAVTLMRRRKVAEALGSTRAPGADLAGLLDVGGDLLGQGLDRGEELLSAQPLQEVDPQPPAVEVALVVDQVGLDEPPAARLELRAHADVHRGGLPFGQRRVDALVGPHEAGVGHQVRRGVAQLPAPAVAVDDLAPDLEGTPQEDPGVGDLARRQK